MTKTQLWAVDPVVTLGDCMNVVPVKSSSPAYCADADENATHRVVDREKIVTCHQQKRDPPV